MTHEHVASTTETHSDNYRKALAQTVSDEAFSDVGLIKLTQTLADDPPPATHASDGIRNMLLDTLDDSAFDHKFIDFYSDDNDSSFSREAITDSDDWESAFDSQQHDDLDSEDADERLVDSYIPGRYKVNALLGSGASGQIFAIQDNNLERNIAVKFMHAEHTEDFDKTQRFIDEAKNTGRLNYPGILPIHDLDFTDGALPFFTMRKTVAHTLETIIDRSQDVPLSSIAGFIKCTAIIIDVCEAVSHAHQQGIVHGDIKPGNISIGNCGDTVLLDWKTCSNPAQRQEEKPKLIGTPIYMSPEQARKEQCDELSDVYCIGGTLFHLLTLRFPLFDKNPRSFWDLKKKGTYQKASALERTTIPPALLAIAEKALSAQREHRYQSVTALRADLLAYQSGLSVSAWNNSFSARCRRGCAKRWPSILLLSLICCLAIWLVGTDNTSTVNDNWQLKQLQNFDAYQQTTLNDEWIARYFPDNAPHKIQEIDLLSNDYWYITDGTLRPRPPIGGFNGYNNLTAKNSASGNLRITWDCIGYRQKPTLNAFLAGTDRFTGYLFEFTSRPPTGTDKNTDSLLLYKRGQLLLSVDLSAPLKENTTYRFQMERINNVVSFYIDQELILSYEDISILNGPLFQHYGFESQSEACRIDNLEVHTELTDTNIPLSAIPDSFLQTGQYALALRYYDDLRRDSQTTSEESDLLLIRSAVCLHALQQETEAAVRLEQLLARNPLHRHALSAHRLLRTIYSDRNDFNKLQNQQKILQEHFAHTQSGAWLIKRTQEQLVNPATTDSITTGAK